MFVLAIQNTAATTIATTTSPRTTKTIQRQTGLDVTANSKVTTEVGKEVRHMDQQTRTTVCIAVPT